MSPIDVTSLASGRPRTTDGRDYPEHLRPYEALDAELLPVLVRTAPATFDALSIEIDDVRLRAALPRWLASAEWRGLIQRQARRGAPRTYVVAAPGAAHVPHAA